MKSHVDWFLLLFFLCVLCVLSGSAQVSGAGTTNRIPIWTNSTTLGSSKLIQSGGKVGLGTSSPAATLDVIGANGTIKVSGGNAPMTFQVTGGRGALSGVEGAQGAGGSIMVTSGNGSGGPGSPQLGGRGATILITGGAGATCLPTGLGCGRQIPGDGGSITLQPGFGGFGGHKGRILLSPSGGNVGVGVTTPTHSFEIAVGGTTLADVWMTRSSRQFKTNIEPLQGALEKVERLQGVSYDRKSDAKHEIGVIAEDVDQIVPEVVSRDPETKGIQGVDYARLVALLIEAVKSQQAEIQQLKQEIEQIGFHH